MRIPEVIGAYGWNATTAVLPPRIIRVDLHGEFLVVCVEKLKSKRCGERVSEARKFQLRLPGSDVIATQNMWRVGQGKLNGATQPAKDWLSAKGGKKTNDAARQGGEERNVRFTRSLVIERHSLGLRR